NTAFEFSRSRNFLYKLYSIWKSQEQKPNFNSQIRTNEEKTTQMLEELAKKINTNHSFPSANLIYSGSTSSLKMNSGQIGREVLIKETVREILDNIQAKNNNFEAKVASRGAELNPEETIIAKNRALKFVNIFLEFQGKDLNRQLNDQALIELLSFPEGADEKRLEKKVADLAKQTNRQASDAVFNFDKESLEVFEFLPPRDGLELDLEKTKEQITKFIKEIDDKNCEETQCDKSQQFYKKELLVKKTPPKTALDKTNKLGIKKLIGFGDSHYEHSIPNRIHNVAHASKLINNSIVAPGEEFSLVKTLGEVSKRTGFKSAYVINKGATVLGDGGGVCQVSTTVFRSALDAGLNITRRLPHSYRVSYYELNSKPGVDATVYTGNVDLRFVNDTPNHILIHNEVDSKNLYMKVEIYGTSDGRSAEIIDHKTYGYTSPPATQFIPSPDLPTGVRRQIERATPGIKAEFTHLIRDKNDNVISEKKYFSNYRAWGAKYLVGM
ncbi:MAG: VanW family protein, partial [Patescibacteria group bacterium]